MLRGLCRAVSQLAPRERLGAWISERLLSLGMPPLGNVLSQLLEV